MTIILGMYYDNKKGALIASDSRETLGLNYGLVKKMIDVEGTIFSIAGDEIIEEEFLTSFKELMKEKSNTETKQTIREVMKELSLKYNEGKEGKKGFERMQGIVGFNIEKPEIWRIYSRGVEPIESFRTMGAGDDITTYLLKKSYAPQMSKEQAMNLAVYSILEVSKVNNGVDNNPQITLIENGNIRTLNYDSKQRFVFESPKISGMKKRAEEMSKQQTIFTEILLGEDIKLISQLEKLIQGYKKNHPSLPYHTF